MEINAINNHKIKLNISSNDKNKKQTDNSKKIDKQNLAEYLPDFS